jgi:hypothetical protein
MPLHNTRRVIGAWSYEIDISRTPHWQFPEFKLPILYTSPLQYNIGYQVDCLALADTNCEASFTAHLSTDSEDGQVRLLFFSAISNGYT